MASMNVSVPDPMRDWVQERIESGKYASVSDYVRDLIRKDQTATTQQERWLASVDAAINRSLADVDAGRVVDGEEVFERLQKKYVSMAEAREKK